MRFYNVTHKHYRGIALHARNMYTCVLDQEGNALLDRDRPTDPRCLLEGDRSVSREARHRGGMHLHLVLAC